MKFPASTVAAIAVASSSMVGLATAFQPAFKKGLSSSKTTRPTTVQQSSRTNGCNCPRCGVAAGLCQCFFGSAATQLFSSVDANVPVAAAAAVAVEDDDEAVPAAVEAMDGIESDAEAHNVNRPARQSIAKRPGGKSSSSGKPLSEFTVGDTVTGTVKTLTTYGAFIDIGAETDGLLHISNLSAAFVADVKDVLQQGQECSVRILEINSDKKQLALTMLTADEQETQQEAKKQPSSSGGGGSNRSNVKANSIILNQLIELDVDSDIFVTGTVVNIVDFGAFVRIDCSQFDDAINGEIDGLVHVSQLQGGSGRVSAVTDVVQEGQEVQVRLKSIDGQKVSLTMVSVEDEMARMEDNESKGGSGRGDRGGYNDDGGEEKFVGNQEWKEMLAKVMADRPPFRNGAVLWEKKSKKVTM